MGTLEITANAKINLTLDVLGKRPDGFHEVEMIMQEIDLHDTLTFEICEDGRIELTCDHPTVPTGEGNLIVKAARALQATTGCTLGARIRLQKRIPIEAGLAGGSTDAAATLKGLNQLWNLGLSLEQLAEIGGQLGSDVPFCIYGGTAIARGRGEKLEHVTGPPPFWVILIKPAFGASTAAVYKGFKANKVSRRPDTKGMLASMADGNLRKMAGHLCNVLETVTFNMYPELILFKEQLQRAGCVGVLMSGSGPTIFGLIEQESRAKEIVKEIANVVDGAVKEIHLAQLKVR